MSSKNGTKRYGGQLRRSWSIASKLTAHYALSAFIILTLSTGLLYWGLAASLDKQSSRYLKDEINVFKKLLSDPATEKSIEQKIEVGYAAREFMKTYARILDGEGRILLETYQMTAIIPPSAFPVPTVGGDPYGTQLKWRNRNGKTYLMRVLWIDPVEAKGKRRILQLALESTSMDNILLDYQDGLELVLFLGIIVSAGAGLYISRKGMRPLREISERTSHITVTNLGERLEPMNWPAEIDELARSLDAMLDRLQQSFKRLNQYSANLAHELRTPIVILRGEAEVALSKARTADEYIKIIESSLEEYERLSNMIDSLLFLARSANRESPLNFTEIDVCSELENICDYYAAMANEKRIELTCKGNAKLTADAVLFRRAVGNLVSNALKYTANGGSVHVSARHSEDEGVAISLSDTGCGISAEHLGKVFDRFYRIDSTRHLNPHGSGLGLSIAKSILELHGGTVFIESEPSVGTTVTLRFPPKAKKFFQSTSS